MKRATIISKHHRVRHVCFASVKTGRDLEGAARYSRRRRARRAAAGRFMELMAPVVMLEGFMVVAMFAMFMVVMLKRFVVRTMFTRFMMVMMLKGSMMVTALKGFMMVMAPVRKLALAAWPMVVVLIIYTNNIKCPRPRKHSRKILTNHKAQRLLLADALTSN